MVTSQLTTFLSVSPSSKPSQLSSEEDDLGRVNSMSSVGANPAPTTGLMTANPSVVASRQTVSSKDDASIASGSSGCGSLTKKKTPIIGSGMTLQLKWIHLFKLIPT